MQNHQRVQAAEQESGHGTELRSVFPERRLQSKPDRNRIVVSSPQGKGEIADELGSELDQRLHLKPLGERIIVDGCGDRKERERGTPFIR